MRKLLRALLATVLAAGLSSAAVAAPKRAREKAPEAPARAAPATPRPAPAPARSGEADTGGEIKRGERIEFDERLIQGQTAKAGALYLFDRKPSDLRSMVHERESYRGEIVQQIFPDQEGTP